MIYRRVQTSGHVDKRVSCEKCKCDYRYSLRRSVTGLSFMPLFMLVFAIILFPLMLSPWTWFFFFARGGRRGQAHTWLSVAGGAAKGTDEATEAAHKKLGRRLRGDVEPVPCPDCGHYQSAMVRELRRRAYGFLGWIAVAIVPIGPMLAWWFVRRGGNLFPPIGPLQGTAEALIVGVAVACLFAATIMALRSAMAYFLVHPNRDSFNVAPATPMAVRECDHHASIAAAVAKLTASRNSAGASRRGSPRA
jgi:hypothetical protein